MMTTVDFHKRALIPVLCSLCLSCLTLAALLGPQLPQVSAPRNLTRVKPRLDIDYNPINQRTLILVKPDGVQRGFIGDIISRFERKGAKLLAIKFVKATVEQIEEHYKNNRYSIYYEDRIRYMLMGPIVPMVWEGPNMIKMGRLIIGDKKSESAPGAIRSDFSMQWDRNVIHGSDCESEAEREIAVWFKPEEIVTWTSEHEAWLKYAYPKDLRIL